jgi:hypothetical protein
MFEDGVVGNSDPRQGKDRRDDEGYEAQVRVCTIFAWAALVHQRRRHLSRPCCLGASTPSSPMAHVSRCSWRC